MGGSRKFFMAAMVLVLAASLIGCSGTKKEEPKPATTTPAAEAPKPAEGPKMVLRMAEIHPVDYPTNVGNLDFAKRVKEATNGRIQIDVYHGGQLGDEKAVIEQVQLGAIDFARISTGPMAEFSKKIDLFSMPYIFDSEEHMWKVLNGPIGQEIFDSLKGSRVVGLTYYEAGARSFYNAKRPVKTPADLKGLKIRVMQNNTMLEMVKAFGASATPMAMGEVYNAIKTGVIDGAENNPPSYTSASHFEVAKYYTLDRHLRVPEITIASEILWNKLSDADKKILKDAAKASTETQRKAWKEYEKKSMDLLKSKGYDVIEITDVKPWQDAVAPVYKLASPEVTALMAQVKAAK